MSSLVPEGWEISNFGSLCTFTGGSAFKECYQGDRQGDYPFIKVSDMNLPGNERYVANANNWISEAIRVDAKVKLFPEGAIVFAKVGAALLLNRRRMLSRETAIDNNMMAAIPKTNNSEYMYYLLQDTDLREIVQSGAVPSVNQTQMEAIPLLIPKYLPEQQKIAAILTSVDNVIESTQAQINKLQDLKTGMMQELLTRGIGHSEFKDSPVGRIPVGWECKKIGELFHIQLGKMLSKAAKVGDKPLPYLGNKNVQWGRVDLSNLETMDFTDRERQKFSLETGDLLMCEGGDVGRSAIWEGELTDCYYQKAIHRLRVVAGGYNCRLLLEYMKFAKERGLLTEFVSQTSIAHLTKEKLASVPVPVPPLCEQEQITKLSASIDVKADYLQAKHNKFIATKKALMQDLLTGKVRVKTDG